MSDSLMSLIEDCFLQAIPNAQITNNVPSRETLVQQTLKTEMPVMHLNDESKDLVMKTLRSIHGKHFHLDEPSKYKDRGGKIKKSFWEDRGTLFVQSISNYASNGNATPSPDRSDNEQQPEQRYRKYATQKLQEYGFNAAHCTEAYDHCNGDTSEALHLLFRKYMNITEAGGDDENMSPDDITEIDANNFSEQELLDMRCDEREALQSIYEKTFEEKEKNAVWSLKFTVDHLLQYSPSLNSKLNKALLDKRSTSSSNTSNKGKIIPPCRNFEKNGTCKFGNKCRFPHVPQKKAATAEQDETKTENVDDKWLYLEIHFPAHTKYPYEPPYIYIKTTCGDVPNVIQLKLMRQLYEEAQRSTKDGIPCTYSISEFLQCDELLSKVWSMDDECFPAEDKSLFFKESVEKKDNNILNSRISLATHYEKGQTSHDENFERNPQQTEKQNRFLLKRFLERRQDEHYLKMMSKRQQLPAFAKMMDILNLLHGHQVLVISGDTGCGKSTQIPQFILDDWLFKGKQLLDMKDNTAMPNLEIICTQPRRLSAIGVAERVADERAEKIGQIVGYQIRLENNISAYTRLTFCTTGILLRRLTSDPLLKSITHIIIDEVHERTKETDYLLMILKHIIPMRRNLKIILMSATLNAKLFSKYFGTDVPIIEIPGRTYPVQQYFLEDILDRCNYVLEADSPYSRKINKKSQDSYLEEMDYADVLADNEAPTPHIKDEQLKLSSLYVRYNGYKNQTCKTIYLMEAMKINPELIESVLNYIVEGDHDWPRHGSILIFLPGLSEIQSVHEHLCESNLFGPRGNKFILIPLHSTLSSEEQSAVFETVPLGKRKIVLSTNIAETSITIDDCVYVIDSGLMKEKCFDTNRNMESLDIVWISRANGNQRKGRAGRVMSGICIHLYTQFRFKYSFLSQPIPEIHRVPLEQLVLKTKTLPNFTNQNVLEVLGQTLEPPTDEQIFSAIKRLQDVGALDEAQQLTPLGHHLSALPVDVRLGKLMLFGAIFQCLDSILTIAACLSHKTPFISPFNERNLADKVKQKYATCNSDHLTCLLAYKLWLDVSKRNFAAGRNYASEHYLSLKTLLTISDIKYQYLELLVSIGFVPINVPRKRKNASDNIFELTGPEFNINGNNNRLLISLLCAALYPNIVKILRPERTFTQSLAGALPKATNPKHLRFKTQKDGYVAIHPSSINSNVGNFQFPFLIYQEKLKTSRVFIRECSMLPLLPLVLFAGSDLKVELHDGDFLFLLEDGWIVIKAHNHETAEMVQCLRSELFKILEEKIRDPCLNLINHPNGQQVIQTIVYLIGHNN